MDQIIWQEGMESDFTPPKPLVTLPQKKAASLPGALFGVLYCGGILWGSLLLAGQPTLTFLQQLPEGFLSRCGTGSLLTVAMELFVPAALMLTVVFFSGFSALGFVGNGILLLLKGAVYGLTAAGLSGEGFSPLLQCAALLAPFEALGTVCLINMAVRSSALSLGLLKTMGESSESAFPLGKNAAAFCGILMLLSLFALLSAGVCGLVWPKLPQS